MATQKELEEILFGTSPIEVIEEGDPDWVGDEESEAVLTKSEHSRFYGSDDCSI